MITTEQYNELCSIARRKYPQNGIDILHDYIIEFNENYNKIKAYLYTQGYYLNIKYRTEYEKQKIEKRVLETPKKCSHCKEEKTPNEFYIFTDYSTGRRFLSYLCKKCSYLKTKKQNKEIFKKYYLKNKEKILSLKRLKIANETPEQREIRLAKKRVNYKKRRTNETPEQREIRLAKYRELNRKYRKIKKANETPEQREIRLAKHREYKRKMITNETLEEKEIRLAKHRKYNKKYREKKRLNKEQTKG